MFSAGDNGPFVGNIGNQHKLVPFILIIQLNTRREIISLAVTADLSQNCFMMQSLKNTSLIDSLVNNKGKVFGCHIELSLTWCFELFL